MSSRMPVTQDLITVLELRIWLWDVLELCKKTNQSCAFLIEKFDVLPLLPCVTILDTDLFPIYSMDSFCHQYYPKVKHGTMRLVLRCFSMKCWGCCHSWLSRKTLTMHNSSRLWSKAAMKTFQMKKDSSLISWTISETHWMSTKLTTWSEIVSYSTLASAKEHQFLIMLGSSIMKYATQLIKWTW